jgi:hypothetical protein
MTQRPWKEYDCDTDGTPERGHLAGDIWGFGRDGKAAIVARAYYCEDDSVANARLIASAPAMLEAIATAGRIVGQVQDNPRMSADERAYALSRASDALGGTYFQTTGQPLEWWQPEPAIAKATKEVSA